MAAELAALVEGRYAKTANRSVVGVMTEFAFLADAFRDRLTGDLLELSLRLAGTPSGPLRPSYGFPDRELAALVSAALGEAVAPPRGRGRQV